MSKQLFDSLIDELKAGNAETVDSKLAELTDEQIDALFSEARAFKSIGPASTKRVVVAAVSNLREKYLKKLLTTALVSFLFQMKDEYTVDDKDLTNPPNKDDFMYEVAKQEFPPDFNKDSFYYKHLNQFFHDKFPDNETTKFADMEAALTEDELLQVGSNANAEFDQLSTKEKKLDTAKYNDAVQAAIKTQSDTERLILDKFLGWLFKFDENDHLEKGEHPIVDDPERQDIEELKGSDPVYDNIPPNDTHCRFNSYYEINYDKLRDATHNIYGLNPDLEHAMIVYDVLDSQEEAAAFVSKYGSSAKNDIVSFNLNTWTFMGPFKENRQRIDYYNKHNSIIKALLDQQESDNMLAEDLMKKRVKSAKVKAEKIFDKDSPGFDQYRQLSSAELEDKFGAKVENISDDKIKVVRDTFVDSETGEAIKMDADGVPSNALEVPITTINARTGEVAQSRIFTRAEQ